MFGRVTIATQLDESYRLERKKHNDDVNKNRNILSKLIDSVLFCDVFELALQIHDENVDSVGIYKEQLDFVTHLENAMATHLENATLFKGYSSTVQNQLLDCMLDVTREFIIQQMETTKYVAIQVHDTADVCPKTPSVLIYRYIDDSGILVERFYGFNRLKGSSNETLATAFLDDVNHVFPESCDKEKVIALSYYGALVMSGTPGGVNGKVSDVYPNAHYVHCYTPQLNVIMQQALSEIQLVEAFFADLIAFPAFFSHYPERIEVLQKIVSSKLRSGVPAHWDFQYQAIGIIHDYRDDLMECCETIVNCGNFHISAMSQARAINRILVDGQFLFFLFLFHDLMPHVYVLERQLHKLDNDSVNIKKAIAEFDNRISKVWESIDKLDSRLPEDSSFGFFTTPMNTLKEVGKEACNILIVNAKERFAFTEHLFSATLLRSDLFQSHVKLFPVEALIKTIQSYPMLKKELLQRELSILYERPEFRCASGIFPFLSLFFNSDLEKAFPETVKLLRILITTPMTTEEPQRCFSTVKKIKTFLRNTLTQERVNAVAMLSIEKKLIEEIPDFHKKTIEKFANLAEWNDTFLYKR